jgi:CRP/FNR family cyclic AMP-dependent transcriptional regulator
MTNLEPILKEHPFFSGMDDADIALISGCAKNTRFKAGETIVKAGDPADEFFLIREGRVAVALPSPKGGRLTIETLESGEIAGWSWLFPPNIWQFDFIAVVTIRALSIDGRCLRGKCEEDPRLGYDLMKRFSKIMVERLTAVRLQAIDLYGKGEAQQ